MYPDLPERRRHQRLDFRSPVRYRKIDLKTNDFKGSLMKDISAGGARMTVYEFLPLNLKLAMQIPLSSTAKSVEGVGRVAWITKAAFNEQYDVGLEFLGLNQEDQRRIAELVSPGE